jgi:hypothetical protein
MNTSAENRQDYCSGVAQNLLAFFRHQFAATLFDVASTV